MPLLKLPNEILIQIADCLEPRDFTSFLVLNRFFQSLLTPLLHSVAFSDPTHYLNWASRRGHEHLARLLLDGGVSPNLRSSSYMRYPLHEAARYGHLPIVRLLLQHGANLRAEDEDCGTALHYAAGSAHPDIVRLLLEHGADSEINGDMKYSITPLMWAIKGLQGAYAQDLERANPACPWDHYWNMEGAVDALFSAEELVRLRRGVMARMYQVVHMLLEWGASVTYADDYGESVLHAVASLEEFDAADTAELLLKRDADVNAADNDGVTPLHMAAMSGLVAIARLFLEYGADVDAVDRYDRKPVDLAANRDQEMIDVLERASEAKKDKRAEQ